jgi:hypothetical protein
VKLSVQLYLTQVKNVWSDIFASRHVFITCPFVKQLCIRTESGILLRAAADVVSLAPDGGIDVDISGYCKRALVSPHAPLFQTG